MSLKVTIASSVKTLIKTPAAIPNSNSYISDNSYELLMLDGFNSNTAEVRSQIYL